MEAVEAIFDDIYNIVARQGFYTVLDLKKNSLTDAKENPLSSTNNYDRDKSASVPSSRTIDFGTGSNFRVPSTKNVPVTTATVNKSHSSGSISKRQTNEYTSKEICSFRAVSSRGTTHDEHINKGVKRRIDRDTELYQQALQEVIDLVPSKRGKKSASHSSCTSKEKCVTVTESKSVDGIVSIPEKSDGKGVIWISNDADSENRIVASLRKKHTVSGRKNGVGQRSCEQKLVTCIASSSNELVPSSRSRKANTTDAVHPICRASDVTVAPPREPEGKVTSATPATQEMASGKSDKDVIMTSAEEVTMETPDIQISSPKLIPSFWRAQDMGHDSKFPGCRRRRSLNRLEHRKQQGKCLVDVGPVTLKESNTNNDKSSPVSDVLQEVTELSVQQTRTLNSNVTGTPSPKVMQILKADLVANMAKKCAEAPATCQIGSSTRLKSTKGHNLLNAREVDLQDAGEEKRNQHLPKQTDTNPTARTKGHIQMDSSTRPKSRAGHTLLKRQTELPSFKDSEVVNVTCNRTLVRTKCTSQDSNLDLDGSVDRTNTQTRRSYRTTKPVFRQYKYFPCFSEKKKCDKKKSKPKPKGKNMETKSKLLAMEKNCNQKLKVKDSKTRSKCLKRKNCKKRKIAKVSGVNDVLVGNRKSMKPDVFTDEIRNKQNLILAEHIEITETVEDSNIMSALCQLESKGKSLQLHDINLLMPMTNSFPANQKQAGRLHGNGSENHPGGVWRRLIPEN